MSTTDSPRPSQPPAGHVDPRAPRFGAAITTVLILIAEFFALIGNSTDGTLASSTLLQRAADAGFIAFAVIAALFAWSLISQKTHPWSVIYRAWVRPRLAPPSEWEDARPPRFAQGVGLFVVGVGLVLHLIGVPWALVIAGAAAFVAAALNATIGLCLGCELYLLLSRAGVIRSRPQAGV